MPPKLICERELVYQKIQRELLQNIIEGKWRPNDLIPSEHQLARVYRASTGTVKKAILNLVANGHLYRIQGKGTYVAGSPFHKDRMRFYRSHDNFYSPELDYTIHFVSCGRIPPFPTANLSLELPLDRELIRVGRIMRMGSEPYVLIFSYFDAEVFGNLVNEPPKRFETHTMTTIFERSYNTSKQHNQELFCAAPCPEEVAPYLGLQPGHPVLLSEMLSYAFEPHPYEYRQSFCMPNRKIYRAWF